MIETQRTIGGLSPEKRALLELRLKERGQSFNTFPLSFAQERLWLIDQLGPGSPAYNIPIALQLSGLINIPALEQTVNEIVRRHEVLRTTYRMIDAGPVQAVSPVRAIRIPLVDLTLRPENQREIETKRLMEEEAQRPFNLMTGPIFRVTLLQLDQREHVLLFTMHHIASDMWSTGVLEREVALLYEAFSEGRLSPLEDLPIQYADFAVWQRKWLQGEVLDQQLGYWKKQLEGVPPILELPTDRPRPPVQTLRGDTLVMELSEELSNDLRELGKREDATLFMLMLAAFKVLLHHYTSQSDLVVGIPIANRNRVQTETLIGFFVNMLVLRTDLSGDPTFPEVVRRVRQTSLGAYAHQDLPFERIVQELNPERNQSFAPLVQVSFGLQAQTREEEQYEMRGLTLRALDTASGTSKFDLVQKIVETKKGLTSYLHYNTDIFEEATIRRMATHFRQLLENIVGHPGAQISELSLLSEEERHQQLNEWNDTSVTYARHLTLHELFEAQAAATPEASAVVYEDEQLSYRELNERANQLGHYLQALGVGPETLVALCCERSIAMVVALLGVLKAGGAYLPLDPQYPHERLAFMMQDAGVSLLLTQTQLAATGIGQWAGEQTRVIELETEWERISQRSIKNLAVTSAPDNLAYVIYTSGSTGQPKGTLITHYNVTRLLDATCRRFAFSRHDVWTLFHSYAFDFSVWELWGALAYGGQLVVVPYAVSRSPLEFYKLLRGRGVTVLNQTPSAFRQLGVVEAEGGAEERAELALRLVIFGGEALEWQSLRGWFERHGDQRPQLVNMYGITETTVHVTVCEVSLSRLEEASAGSVIGKALDDLQIYLLDRRMELLPAGVWGELYVGGAGLGRGYLKRAELTAERFVPNPYADKEGGGRLYRTGDVGRYRGDGEIEYLGRADSQVKIRGFRIETGEIEGVLSAHAQVREVVVITREDVPGDQRLVAYLVGAKTDGNGTGAEAIDSSLLRAYVKEKLPDYMVPSAFVSLQEMPLTPNGKVDRRALPAPDTEGLAVKEYVAPRDALEMELTKIWESVLSLKNVGIRDDFFELGGHSLLAVRVFGQIGKVIDVDLPLSTLFQAPTIELLAAVLRKRSGVVRVAGSSLVELHGEGSLRPLFFVHPGSGNIFCYIELSRLLGKDQPVYAFQSKALEQGTAWPSIEQMAEHYIELLRGVQTDGPYCLSGLSLGGVVAFEMSRQLENAGQKVSFLAIIDAPAPRVMKLQLADDLLLMLDFAEVMGLLPESISLSQEEALQMSVRERLAYVLEQGQREGSMPLEITLATIERLWEVFQENVRALMVYGGGNYRGKATLFTTAATSVSFSSDGQSMGWEEFVTGGVQVEELPGTHHTIVQKPYVGTLANRLRAHLRSANRNHLLKGSSVTL